jgi:hypothetical protein
MTKIDSLFQFAVVIDDKEPLPHKAAHIVLRFLDGREIEIDKSRTYTLNQLTQLIGEDNV